MTEGQKAEIDRRLADLEADPVAVLAWEEIARHVRRAGAPTESVGAPANRTVIGVIGTSPDSD